MSTNNGTQFELDFMNALNEKHFSELSENLQKVVKMIFPNVSSQDIVKSEKCDPYGKPDISIIVNGVAHFVSLKTNTAKHVHSESLNVFVDQLKNYNISNDTINVIKKFHYGDGTLNGKGEIRMSYDELFPTMISEIKIANEELNQFNERMVKIVDKFLFEGNDSSKQEAEFIYHGSLNFGVLCSRKQVIKHLRRRNYDYMRNLHIGPLQFHPYARYASFKEKNPYKREIVNFVWVNFISDLEYISEHYSLF